MASKLPVLAALFVCFIVLADASFRVTTTVVDEDENPQQRQQRQQCQQQLQRQRLQSCHNFIQRQQRSSRGRNDEDWDILDEMNPQQSVQQCCNELQQINRDCRCEALQQLQRQAQQYQQGGRSTGRQQQGGQQQRVQQQIRRLPQMCSLQVPQQCQQGY